MRIDRIEEIYFSSFEMPLRGLGYYADEGNRFFLSNIEFRFPFIRYMQTGLPLPIFLSNIAGAAFMDMGIAWDRDEPIKLYSPTPTTDGSIALFNKAPNGFIRTQDLLATIGLGLRINLGFFLLRIDFAWPTDFYQTSKEMEILWSLGADF